MAAEEADSSGTLTAAQVSASPKESAEGSLAMESLPTAEAASATSAPALAETAAPSEPGKEPVKEAEKTEDAENESGGAGIKGIAAKDASAKAPPAKDTPVIGTSIKDAAAKDNAAAMSTSSAKPSPKPAAITQAPANQPADPSPGAGSSVASAQSAAAQPPKAPSEAATASPAPETSPPQGTAAVHQSVTSAAGNTAIDWNGFFDGSDQTRPSEQFWDLSGSTVTIKGFMGEVLSFEKNWFLLIPEPGAECPFDNGDETYWNKIMIVFVPEGSKLRYTSDPLEITGRLDVGIKIDESGYKTMFRLYDASFKSLK
ncbi:hypothetical protein C2I18_09605 [Paenibacillus sp. PK3_47]|nr:hypothetical protein C2I18_09605 [Paenibacillus sp. PK3_47]